MIRGLYISAGALAAQENRHETISQNLANLNTTGYKRLRLGQQEAPQPAFSPNPNDPSAPPGAPGEGILPYATFVDLSDGPLQATDNPLDVALRGPAFLAVQTPDGIRLTRAGHLTRNAQGQLATAAGDPILGDHGPISLPAGTARIDTGGTVWVAGQAIDRLRILTVTDPRRLQPLGSGLFAGAEEEVYSSLSDIALHPGALEGSNVNAVEEMVDMITALRAYEANQKMIALQDETLGRAVNEIARL